MTLSPDGLFLVLVGITLAMVAASVAVAVLVVVLRWRSERKASRWKRLEGVWEPLVLEVLAGSVTPETLHRRVADADRLYFVGFLLRYAHRLRGNDAATVRDLATPYLDRVAELARSDAPERRARAVGTLATLGLPEHEDAVVRALDDPSPIVAVTAARALGDHGGARYLHLILEHLDRYELWSGTFVADLLARMGPDAVPELRRVYGDGSALPVVRAICADALGRIGVPDVADLAVEVLATTDLEAVANATAPERDGFGVEVTRHGHERELVLASLKLLARLGSAEHLPLVRRLAQAPAPVVRAVAITTLGELGGEDDVPRLAAALSDPSHWVALHAARGLVRIGDVADLERLAESGGERAGLAREVLAG